MLNTLRNIVQLARAGVVLAWYGVSFIPQDVTLPKPARAFKRWRSGGEAVAKSRAQDQGERLSGALQTLGPTYIKLGQFLATRPDIIGQDLAGSLGRLRDRLPPFGMGQAKAEIEEAFGRPASQIFVNLSPPLAAASIAQVHKAEVLDNGAPKAVAVKILRPGIERRFARDLDSFMFAARMIERIDPRSRRLRPVAAVETLAASVVVEMDLRLEAAAISEMAENIANAGDTGFRVPQVDWRYTSRRVLTLEWIDGIPLANHAAIDEAGIDRRALGLNVIRSFLRHAMRDGFFHADMHEGNLFADPRTGDLIAVDFGIMGRLSHKERRFLAEILYGFITRNYRRIAEVHFEAGYVPADQDVASFAQALRSIGEPIKDRPANEISMARLLTQLFEITELFNMRMRPELLLLQKTMVVVEGVARSLDTRINIWNAAEPVVREWMTSELGPAGRLREAAQGLSAIGGVLQAAPRLFEQGVRLADAIAEVDSANKVKTIDRMFNTAKNNGWGVLTAPLWLAGLGLAAIALKLWLG
jgi:ubiquinone biosynthesis protein